MAITLKHRMDMDELRGFCIRHNYYTGGTGVQYDRLLTELRDNVNSAEKEEDILDAMLILAEDILIHSDIGKGLEPYTDDWASEVDNLVFLLLYENVLLRYVDRND